MKILAAFLLITTASMQAGIDPTTEKPSQNLRNQVATLLEAPPLTVEQDMIESTIYFTVNSKGEIVVLDVATDSEQIANFVKGRLNYAKVPAGASTAGKLFNIVYKIKRS